MSTENFEVVLISEFGWKAEEGESLGRLVSCHCWVGSLVFGAKTVVL
jgi:hypothetical protein